MKYIYFLLSSLIFFTSCSDGDAPQDTETNRYYADYIDIYNAYDSLGGEQTIKSLDIYLEEFPERKEAYIFKGYVLGQMGAYAKADVLFEEAKKRDSSNVQIYEYQSAFLLYDSTQWEKANNVIQEGLAISDSSVYLYTNLAWLQVFNEDYISASMNVYNGLNYDEDNLNLLRLDFILAYYRTYEKEVISKQLFAEDKGVNTGGIIETLNEKGPFGVYKNIAQ